MSIICTYKFKLIIKYVILTKEKTLFTNFKISPPQKKLYLYINDAQRAEYDKVLIILNHLYNGSYHSSETFSVGMQHFYKFKRQFGEIIIKLALISGKS